MQEKRDSIERLKDKLYSRDANIPPHERSDLSRSVDGVAPSWGAPAPVPDTSIQPLSAMAPAQKKKSNAPLIIFLASGLFFAVSLMVAGFIFLRGSNVVSSDNIDLQILGPSLVDGGKEASLQILIDNDNTTALTLADLILEYPEGTRSTADVTRSLTQERISLGDIPAGGSLKQTASAVLFGEEGATRTIRATLEYRVAGSNAIFVKEGSIDLIIGSSPVTLTVEGPIAVTAGKELSFVIKVSSNATTPIRNVVLEAQYPFGFTVTSASPETSVGDALWQIGELKPREEKTIRVGGVLEGQDGEERVFRFSVGSLENATDVRLAVPFITIPHSLSIQRPFISGNLSLNGVNARTVAVYDGKDVHGIITWQNNLDTEVRDLRIEAKLSGAAYDRGSVVVSRGFWRSSDSTMLWDSSQDASLSVVAPGASGQVDFSLVPSSGGGTLKNPEVSVTVNLRASRSVQGQVPESVSSAITGTMVLATPVSLTGGLLHFDGQIVNQGPVPPKADQETTYTVVWTAKNPSNTIANARVSAPLPPSTRFLGVSLPATEDVSFNPQTGTVTWTIGELRAGVGFSSAARSVAFKIGFTPSLSQVGSAPTIMGEAFLNGEDRFAQTNVNSTLGALTTRFSLDSKFQNGMEVVTQ